MVGRDVLGAPRPRNDIGNAHGYAGRRGRRPLPRTAPHPHTHIARRTRTPCAHLVRRDVPGAPRPRDAHGTTSGTPTGTRAAGDVGPYHVPQHHTPMVGRDVLGAPLPTRTPSQTPTGARAAGDVGPYHVPHHTPMVGRDVLGAPRPRNDIGNAHGYAGRRGRRPLPRTAPRPSTHAMRAPGPARRPRCVALNEMPLCVTLHDPATSPP